MEGGESLLDTLFDEESFEDARDVEMIDAEEGELVEMVSKNEAREKLDVDGNQISQETSRRKSRNKKKKNKRKRSSSTGPSVTNISRFVMDACKRLKERKHYLMWTAVGCLGVSALSDLVKEVDAIQACGGQKTADGSRHRNGGGILWNIIKARDPNAYKEIMTKGKEFEKQMKQPGLKRQSEGSSQKDEQVTCDPSHGVEVEEVKGQLKCGSVHDRIRVPVSYDDLLGEVGPEDTDA
ncbi:hypothetical protein STAS_33828 [Striga asiatica]|uniref:Phosphorylated adapter RNA export protein n=1 Tax=Striga asiatica TaxID=4170 RepID=A0A5A7RG41_STRAF|nr:hypothetical protein STAS_33828 [Striga asiatica]